MRSIPSIAKKLDFVADQRDDASVPWDDVADCAKSKASGRSTEPRPGLGEYLEVVDVDPASDKLYDPVDLNDRNCSRRTAGRRPRAIRSSISRWSTPSA